jgi:membrane protein required for colicin V production
VHYLDIIILVLIIASAVEGGFHGFVYEVFSLLGLIAGFFLAIQFHGFLAAQIDFIPIPLWLLKIVAFLLIVIASNIIFRLAGKSLRFLLRKVFMGWFDHAAGVIFGLVRGVIVVLVITLILMLTPVKSILSEAAAETRFMAPCIEAVKPFLDILPEKKLHFPDVI